MPTLRGPSLLFPSSVPSRACSKNTCVISEAHTSTSWKKQGTITDYSVYQARPRDPQDADLILTVTYKNMAAFDDLQARTDPTAKQAFGSLAKAASASADRGKLRMEVGSQMVRQLILK